MSLEPSKGLGFRECSFITSMLQRDRSKQGAVAHYTTRRCDTIAHVRWEQNPKTREVLPSRQSSSETNMQNRKYMPHKFASTIHSFTSIPSKVQLSTRVCVCRTLLCCCCVGPSPCTLLRSAVCGGLVVEWRPGVRDSGRV